MPHTRGASKRLRQNAKRRLRNCATKKAIKTQVKTVLDAAGGSVDALREQFRVAVKKLDKAAAKRIIHPNMACARNRSWPRFCTRRPKPNQAPNREYLALLTADLLIARTFSTCQPERGSSGCRRSRGLLRRPAPYQKRKRGHQEGSNDKRIQEHAESQRETNLHERAEARQHQRPERPRHDQATGRDRAAGVRRALRGSRPSRQSDGTLEARG